MSGSRDGAGSQAAERASGGAADPVEDAVERHIEVRRTARYWTLGDPASAEEVWFVLHGYKQLARRFLRRFALIAGPRRLVVAPEALSRFYARPELGRHGPASVVGASWMTREDRLNEIRDYVGYLDRVAEEVLGTGAGREAPDPPEAGREVSDPPGARARPRVTVLGFSQGTATAARWVTMGSVHAARLVLWAGYLPHDQGPERARTAFHDTELVLVRGDDDRGLTAELDARERAALEEKGIAYRTVRYAGGHDIDAETLTELASG